ncbi:unnamed protein product [Symbiodinium natans]|uniref:Uncharacterized protein n=1 Tax=Symbiodinium natans TaxID=878477 RepID=A0A812MIF5_9DINO|nr:unnamed protein product [Symbiodinium natans]
MALPSEATFLLFPERRLTAAPLQGQTSNIRVQVGLVGEETGHQMPPVTLLAQNTQFQGPAQVKLWVTPSAAAYEPPAMDTVVNSTALGVVEIPITELGLLLSAPVVDYSVTYPPGMLFSTYFIDPAEGAPSAWGLLVRGAASVEVAPSMLLAIPKVTSVYPRMVPWLDRSQRAVELDEDPSLLIVGLGFVNTNLLRCRLVDSFGDAIISPYASFISSTQVRCGLPPFALPGSSNVKIEVSNDGTEWSKESFEACHAAPSFRIPHRVEHGAGHDGIHFAKGGYDWLPLWSGSGVAIRGPKLKKVFCLYLFVRSRMALWLGLLVGFWSLCATAAHDAAALMAADDECGQENSSACVENRTCVFKPDRSWSQCVPLDDDTFQKECKYWDRKLRLSAINETGLTCNSVLCEYDQDCPLSTVCLSKQDGSWAQCVPLTKKEFQESCVKWEDDFRLAAIEATGFNCPNTRCYSQDWCVRGARCAIQADGTWGQCISCHDDSFQTNCYSWKATFISAAEKACHRKCRYDLEPDSEE